ncbi:hypothetical protein BDU57DRAFT_515042 [Ampelomyces quisqualis]|uniref:BRCT domain-containing protein n=1 Tax=Ampelomyces quisqualis TaxID=50730 RepID=A0A6A5QUV3_AMPQU|nr:hypothetical protein BDU57DRAFT_515042 [Ampelomyces quisqualis]
MKVLSNLVIAITGTLPAEPASIKKWVEVNGGKWSARVDERVTHLIASKEAWKRATDPVVKASQLDIHILSYDWFEDSLQRKRKLAEKKYTWEAVKEDRKRKRQLKKLGAKADGTSDKLPLAYKPKSSKSFFFTPTNQPRMTAKEDLMRRRAERELAEATEEAEKASRAAKKTLPAGTAIAPIELDNEISKFTLTSLLPIPLPSASPPIPALLRPIAPSPSPQVTSTSNIIEPKAKKIGLKDLYHYYLDSTGFEYNITLARSDFTQNRITRYQLSILESHVTPHTYCTFVQYVPPPSGAPETRDNASAAFDSKIRNPLLSFLKQANTEAKSQQTPSTTTRPTVSHTLPHPNEAARLRSLIAPRANFEVDQTELARLHSLVTPTLPSAHLPYKALICPLSSPFPRAWRTFRHTFRDLTHLSWEERFDTHKTIQKARAVALNIEPYIYIKPVPGMPVGLRVQEVGLYQGCADDVMILGDSEDGYVRNEFGLPGLEEELGRGGVVGSTVWKEKEKIEREEEEKRDLVDRETKRDKARSKQKRRSDYDKPLFNGANGRPWEGERRGNVVRKVRPFGGMEY